MTRWPNGAAPVTECEHTDRKHAAKGMCRSCYHRSLLKRPGMNARQNMLNRRYLHRKRLRQYGITQDEYDALLIAQCGRCAICGDELLDIHMDHCHASGVLRGLLCPLCNKGLGHFRDSRDLLTKARSYLEANE